MGPTIHMKEESTDLLFGSTDELQFFHTNFSHSSNNALTLENPAKMDTLLLHASNNLTPDH